MLTTLNNFSDDIFKTDFKLPLAGYRNFPEATLTNHGNLGFYWSSSPDIATSNSAHYLYLYLSNVNASYNNSRAYGSSIRCFKDSSKAPETLTLTFNANSGTLL